MGRKLTINFVKSEFEKEKWKLISTEYMNSNQKLDYICSEGHHGSISWHNWRHGRRCPVCAGVKKLTIVFISSEFNKEGWTLVSKKYINSKTHLKYICSEGHLGVIGKKAIDAQCVMEIKNLH